MARNGPAPLLHYGRDEIKTKESTHKNNNNQKRKGYKFKIKKLDEIKRKRARKRGGKQKLNLLAKSTR